MPAPWAGCRGMLWCSAPQNRHSQALGLLSPSPAPRDPPAQHPAPGTCWGGHGKGHRTVPGVLAPGATLAGTGRAPAGAASAASQKAAFVGGGVCTGWSRPGGDRGCSCPPQPTHLPREGLALPGCPRIHPSTPCPWHPLLSPTLEGTGWGGHLRDLQTAPHTQQRQHLWEMAPRQHQHQHPALR